MALTFSWNGDIDLLSAYSAGQPTENDDDALKEREDRSDRADRSVGADACDVFVNDDDDDGAREGETLLELSSLIVLSPHDP